MEVIVTIDERKYDKARSELGNEAQGYLYITEISSLIICLLQEYPWASNSYTYTYFTVYFYAHLKHFFPALSYRFTVQIL